MINASLVHGFLRCAICAVPLWTGTQALAQSIAPGSVLNSPEDGGPRRLEAADDAVILFSGPESDAQRITEHPRGTVFSNLGCRAAAGDIWCKVAPVPRGAAGYVHAAQVKPATGPDGVVPTGVDTSKSRARAKDFDATRQISCAQEKGQAMGTCAAAVARSGGGDATVVVTFPNGFARQLYFTHGAFIRGSATMSGVGTDMDWTLADHTYGIRVDDQRFEIEERFVLGN
jgi:hypothetical protein